MLNIFIDSDIIWDLLARREPHFPHAAKLFTLIDRNRVSAFTSPLIFATIHYILKKLTSHEIALQSLRKLKTLIHVLPIDEKVIDQSLNSEFKNFEDAIQYFTAVNNGIKIIIARNINDYKIKGITVSTAEQFMRIWQAESKR